MAETVDSLVGEAAAALSAGGFDEPRRHARRMVAAALRISHADLFGNPGRVLDEGQIGRIRTVLGRVLSREPLSRILGRREFWGLNFALSAETLDPRPETETVVEAVLRRYPDRRARLRFLDLGTGTGCLLLALLAEFPAASGVGIDVVEGAVRTAVYNATQLGLGDRAVFFVGDWAAAATGKFDAVVANPPYIASGDLKQLPREVACFDPCRALDGGADGLAAYRAIAAALPALIAPDGHIAFEVGIAQADMVAAILERNGLVVQEIDSDLAGIARCIIACPGRMTVD